MDTQFALCDTRMFRNFHCLVDEQSHKIELWLTNVTKTNLSEQKFRPGQKIVPAILNLLVKSSKKRTTEDKKLEHCE